MLLCVCIPKAHTPCALAGVCVSMCLLRASACVCVYVSFACICVCVYVSFACVCVCVCVCPDGSHSLCTMEAFVCVF